jgi:uncharacterized membrane protein YidH (DUF202 family)
VDDKNFFRNHLSNSFCQLSIKVTDFPMTTPPEQPPSSPKPVIPDPQSSVFLNFDNNELAVIRTDLAGARTTMAESRTDMSVTRTDLARDRNRMAAERTLMAWIRTALAMISFGFGIDRFFKYLDKTSAPTPFTQLSEERLLGLSLMVLGVFALGGALVIHWQALQRIDRKDYKYIPDGSLGVTVAIILLFISIATFIPLLVGEVQLGEIFSLQSPILTNLTKLTIFTLMLTMGVAFSIQDLTSLIRQPSLLGRSLLSALVLFPLVVGIVLYVVDLPGRSVTALVILACAPAAPLLTKRVSMARPSLTTETLQFAASLQITLAILSVIVTPLLLAVFTAPFPSVQERIHFLQIAKQIAIVQLLPLGIGLAVRQLAADFANNIQPFLVKVANTAFIVLAIFLAGLSYNLLPSVDVRVFWASAAIALLGLLIGHVLGGPTFETRSSLAIGTIARNAGLALYFLVLNDRPLAIPSVVAYLVVGALVSLPYNVWVKKQMNQSADQSMTETTPSLSDA